MDNRLRLLLQLVSSNADISFLLKNGLSYSQIAIIFSEAMRDGLIAHNENSHEGAKFIVTDQGTALLCDSKSRAELGVQGRWISPDERYKCPQIKLDDIFLPKLKNSHF